MPLLAQIDKEITMTGKLAGKTMALDAVGPSNPNNFEQIAQ